MLEISSKATLEPTSVVGDFHSFINDLNIAAAQGKQFIIAEEARSDGNNEPVAFETRNITRIRVLREDDAFIGR